MSSRSWLRVAQYAFAAVGILALGYCVSVWVAAKVFQYREGRSFAAKEAQAHSEARGKTSPPLLPPPKDGVVLGQLEIPRLHLSVLVVQGVDAGDLRRAAGHIPGTALPGHTGNVGIAAHRDTFFRPLRRIQRDDSIELNTLGKAYRYRVVSTNVVSPDDVQVLYPNGHDILTLVTCFPFDYIGSAPKRFVVRAERLPDAGHESVGRGKLPDAMGSQVP
jgi:sortase A